MDEMTADQSRFSNNLRKVAHRSHAATPTPPTSSASDRSRLHPYPPSVAIASYPAVPPSHGASAEQQLLDVLTQRIHSATSLDTLLSETVEDIRKALQADRVLICHSHPLAQATQEHRVADGASELETSIDANLSHVEPTDWNSAETINSGHLKTIDVGYIAAESTALHYPSALSWGCTIPPDVVAATCMAHSNGRVDMITDTHTVSLISAQREWFGALEVRATISIPIIYHHHVHALLMVQQCSDLRVWTEGEITLLRQLASQLALGLEHVQLHQQLRHLQEKLDAPMSERSDRISPLKQALKFAELVRQVTERVRDSLDEDQILQTSTQELAKALGVDRCKIELYDSLLTTATVVYEHATRPPNCMGQTRQLADFAELYQPLCQHQPIQFVVPSGSNLQLGDTTRLACPIFDDQGMLGNLWLFRPRDEMFHRWEIRIVQQIANECAIAIRQARLYEAAQKQVRELERLNQLKDDFLKTISHELRSPLSSIILGVQTLEKILNQSIEQQDQRTIHRLFQTLHTECYRENKLIEDLLTFCYLEAGTELLMPTSIDLNDWIRESLKPFHLRLQNQQQKLIVELADSLPPLKTELAYLERIFSELLNNACKYTPPGECISISTDVNHSPPDDDSQPSRAAHQTHHPSEDQAKAAHIILRVKNSGIEIPKEEQGRIFDKFYRIPCRDPWKYGGTGLGLALVKKLTECLGASVSVDSVDGQTSFSVRFPFSP